MHGSRLTWMDAAVGGKEITPRIGKAVEIQALWYNAVKTMELLASKFEDKTLATKYREMADKTAKSFNEKFWNPNLHCLIDVLESNGADANDSTQPNFRCFAGFLDA